LRDEAGLRGASSFLLSFPPPWRGIIERLRHRTRSVLFCHFRSFLSFFFFFFFLDTEYARHRATSLQDDSCPSRVFFPLFLRLRRRRVNSACRVILSQKRGSRAFRRYFFFSPRGGSEELEYADSPQIAPFPEESCGERSSNKTVGRFPLPFLFTLCLHSKSS